MTTTPNPLTARLIRTTTRWPSLRLVIGFAAALTLITFAISAYELSRLVLNPPEAAVPIGGIPRIGNGAIYSRLLSISNGFEAGISPRIAVIAWLVALLAPVLTGLVAAVQTGRDAQSDSLTLLRLTGLRRAGIVRGYLWAALYQMRVLLAITVGLLPALIGGALNLMVYLMTYQTFQTYAMFYRAVYTAKPADLLGLTAALSGLALGLLLACVASAALGVLLGLWLRSPIGAAICTTLPTLFAVWASVIAVFRWLTPLRMEYNYVHTAPWHDLVAIDALCLLPPLLLVFAFVNFAPYALRRYQAE